MAGKGFTTLALAYFGAPGLPRCKLSFIWEGDCFLNFRSYASLPLEYFEAALDLLSRHCREGDEGVGVVGSSKGGDLALALAVTQGSKVEIKSLQAMQIIHLRHKYLLIFLNVLSRSKLQSQ